MARPSVIATNPAADVANPMIWPRSPDGMVRPCTSFDAIEHRQRPSENTTSATRMPTPAAVPCPRAAIAAIAATDAACTSAPVTNTHLRRRTRTTSGMLQQWAARREEITPFVADPAARSQVVTTLDVDESIDATAITSVLRAHGVVDIEPYRKLGRNQLRIAMYPAIDPDEAAAEALAVDQAAAAGSSDEPVS